MTETLLNRIADKKITKYSLFPNLFNINTPALIFSIGNKIAILRDNKGQILMIRKRLEHKIFIISSIIDGKLCHFGAIQ